MPAWLRSALGICLILPLACLCLGPLLHAAWVYRKPGAVADVLWAVAMSLGIGCLGLLALVGGRLLFGGS